MSVQIKTLDDYGFLLCFIGGVIVVINGLLYLIVSAIGSSIDWFFGGGFIGIGNEIAGALVTIIFGAFAIVIGMKLFSPKIRAFMIKIDLIITGIVMIVLAIICFGIGALLILIGGILVFIYRLMPEGNANPTGR
ncbi:MAG: hypothetical protein FK734_18670 [Asgard group archaeon]|nr:hypothetical protein [Asgard group archaeon]